jgi:hypothetical protein
LACHAPELLPQRVAKAAKYFVAASRQSAANNVFEMRLSAESRYVWKIFVFFVLFVVILFLWHR